MFYPLYPFSNIFDVINRLKMELNYKTTTIIFFWIALILVVVLIIQESELRKVMVIDELQIPDYQFNALTSSTNFSLAIICDIENNKCAYVRDISKWN